MRAFSPFFLALLLCFGLFVPHGSLAHAEGEVERAKGQLKELETLLDEISLHVERHDLGRIVVLKNAGSTVLSSIDANGLGNLGTMAKYQILCISYHYSIAFFQRVETRRTKVAIARSQALALDIERAIDFPTNSLITEGIMRQMHQLVLDLMDLPLDATLSASLIDLIAPLGRAIAISRQHGDHRDETHAAADAVHDRLKELYGAFDQVRISDVGFQMVINLHGLNEFYGEWRNLPR